MTSTKIFGDEILVALRPKNNQMRLLTMDESLNEKGTVTKKLSNLEGLQVQGVVYPLGLS